MKKFSNLNISFFTFFFIFQPHGNEKNDYAWLHFATGTGDEEGVEEEDEEEDSRRKDSRNLDDVDGDEDTADVEVTRRPRNRIR